MSTTVSYKGETLTTVSNATKTLQTEGKYLEDDITLVDVSGGGAVLTTKNISANGTYNASSDSADGYSQVTVAVPASAVDTGTKNITANGNNQDVVGYAAVNVNVPNSYSAGDEGKVVSNGALVAQTSDTVTTNDTYDTTLINSLTVNVSGGTPTGNDFYSLYTSDWDLKIDTAMTLYQAFLGKQCGAKKICLWNATGASGEYNAQYCLFNLSACTTIVIPKITRMGRNMIQNCSKLEIIDLRDVSQFDQNCMIDNTVLNVLVIRHSSVPTLANINAFNGTCFKSNGTGGTLYVPTSLISSYQSATNWSIILGYANNSIQAIEGSAYENAYADGTPIS